MPGCHPLFWVLLKSCCCAGEPDGLLAANELHSLLSSPVLATHPPPRRPLRRRRSGSSWLRSVQTPRQLPSGANRQRRWRSSVHRNSKRGHRWVGCGGWVGGPCATCLATTSVQRRVASSMHPIKAHAAPQMRRAVFKDATSTAARQSFLRNRQPPAGGRRSWGPHSAQPTIIPFHPFPLCLSSAHVR